MKIGSFDTTAAAEAAGKNSRVSLDNNFGQAAKIATSTSYAEDTTSLKSASDSVRSLTSAALAIDPARAAKVQSLKQAVSQGQYSIEPEKIASALSSAEI